MQAIFETCFDIFYLLFAFSAGIWMLRQATNRQSRLLGWMVIVLGAGDSFHLVPRVLALWSTGLAEWTVPLGIGKFITSITMTVFYILLFRVWQIRSNDKRKGLALSIYLLAAIRIALCLFPQNGWISATPSLAWGIWRNLPFAILGIMISVLFYRSDGSSKSPFHWMWLAILISFGCYVPVVLFAEKYPWTGMLMIPKTMAYIWMIWMAVNAVKEEKTK